MNAVLAANELLEARPTFDKSREQARQWKRAGELRSGAVGPDLSLWFTLRIGGGRDAVAAMVDALNDLDEVEIAHPMPIVEIAAIRNPSKAAALAGRDLPTPDFSGQQGYLYATPTGLDAPAAWTTDPGAGSSTATSETPARSWSARARRPAASPSGSRTGGAAWTCTPGARRS